MPVTTCVTGSRRWVPLLLAAALFGCATTDPYDKVAVGDSREHVISLLGSPLVPERDMTNNERIAVQGAADTMKQNGAASLSVWRQGGVRFEIIGFDANGVVTAKRRFFYRAP